MAYLEIRTGIYHIGDPTTQNGLACNPYLLIDHDEAVLFDPGSLLDIDNVLENIKNLISLDRIRYIVLHHQDPDFCSAVPLLEKQGLQAQIVTSWRAMTLIQYYAIKSPFYVIEEHKMRLQLKSGRTLSFISTPYLHFAGAFTTYDKITKSLFSSDLFGAFSYNQTLFADEQYIDKMRAFHEHYMPSNSILRPVMDVLSLYDIDIILPQHGSIINNNVPDYIEALRTLECGTLLTPVKADLKQSGGYVMIFNEVYKRIASLYPQIEVDSVFKSITSLELRNDKIIGYKTDGETLWNKIFIEIKSLKGILWISVLEPFVKTLSATYDLPLPDVFENTFDEMIVENKKLKEINSTLDQSIKAANNKLVKCQITGLYNEIFLQSLLTEELEKENWHDVGALVCINIDDFSDYIIQYGNQEERTVLNNMAYLLKEEFGQNTVFRLDFCDFALYLKGLNKQDLINKVEQFRSRQLNNDFYLGELTISAGIAFQNEIELDNPSIETTVNNYLFLALERLRIAEISGKNKICYESNEEFRIQHNGKVLIVDTDSTNISLLRTFLEKEGIEVFTTDNGIDAFTLALENQPDIIVSELMLNKLDGFGLRTNLLNNSKTKDIEFIYLSYKKDDETVERAIKLGVTINLHKPYLLSELIGIVKKTIQDNRA